MKLLLLTALSSAILLSACDGKKQGGEPPRPPDVLGTIKHADKIEKMNNDNLNNAGSNAAVKKLHEEK